MPSHKYYWLRLQKDFFKRHDIRIIEAMPNGKDYILFYLKLLVESVSHEGLLRFSDKVPYSMEMLATVTDTNVDVVRNAVDIFKELNMLEVMDDATIFMTEVNKMIGSAQMDEHQRESARLRKQKQRAKEKALLCDSHVTCHGELEIELDIDKDIEDKPKRSRFVKPTLEEVKSYISEKGYNVKAEVWYSYYESNGWKVGRNAMKDWKSCVAHWNAKDNEKKSNKKQDYKGRDYDFEALEKAYFG